MAVIQWSQIEAECGDYRAGFVATFRKYEGRDTDEVGRNGHIIKVTVSSFARHVGIDDETFRRWVKATDQEQLLTREQRTDSHARGARSFAKRLPAAEKAKLAAELASEPEVIDELGRDRDTRQAIRRAADEATLANVPDPSYRRQPSGGAGLGGVADELEVQGLVRKARLAVRDAIEIAGNNTFDADAQSLIVDDIGRVRAGLDHLESAVTSTDVDIDAALADLLDESEG